MLKQPPLFVRWWLSCDAKKDEISQFCHQKSVRTEPRGGRSLLSFYPLSTSFPDLLEYSASFSHLRFREKKPFLDPSLRTHSCRFRLQGFQNVLYPKLPYASNWTGITLIFSFKICSFLSYLKYYLEAFSICSLVVLSGEKNSTDVSFCRVFVQF